MSSLERPTEIYVRASKRRWLRRIFQLSGDVEAVLEYNALKSGVGYTDIGDDGEPDEETHAVLLDGAKIVGSDNTHTLLQFTIPLPPKPCPVVNRTLAEAAREGKLFRDLQEPAKRVAGQIRVEFSRNSFIVQISRFQLQAADEILYEEADGKIVTIKHRPVLPLPADAPSPQGSFPVPATATLPERSPLPLPVDAALSTNSAIPADERVEQGEADISSQRW